MYDKIIIGAGLYGLYAALHSGKKGENVLVLEWEDAAFERATYVNQARIHMGYHYPRSISTALKSRGYFDRFNEDYSFCINSQFDKVYATSSNLSWTSASQFKKFCKDSNIRCDEVSPDTYFKENMCDGAFITTEYTYDAQLLKYWFIAEISKLSNIDIIYGARIEAIENINNQRYNFKMSGGTNYETDFVVNTTYASVNQIHAMLGFQPLKIKYELCEIILCKPQRQLKDIGITVMDGAFFSIMPFGKTKLHSLTSVTFTPHSASHESLPTFPCQERSGGYCSPGKLGNCNLCNAKPDTAWEYMSSLAKKYLKDDYGFEYAGSLYSMKPILKSSEIDDSRPTVIRRYNEYPRFISVLSGKINTVYELDEELIL